MHWYLEVLKKYATFSGRASRSEYWMFLLVNVLIGVGLIVLDGVAGIVGPFEAAGMGVFSVLYHLAVVLPSLSVMVRRLHDTNRSGWWFWIVLIPFIGGIVLFVFLVTDSTPGDNNYGPNPKGVNG